jgi:hypothetical protein
MGLIATYLGIGADLRREYLGLVMKRTVLCYRLKCADSKAEGKALLASHNNT